MVFYYTTLPLLNVIPKVVNLINYYSLKTASIRKFSGEGQNLTSIGSETYL